MTKLHQHEFANIKNTFFDVQISLEKKIPLVMKKEIKNMYIKTIIRD